MLKKDKNSVLVYSTDGGRLCPDCGYSVSECKCRIIAGDSKPAGDGIVRLGRETKGRKGKGVTVITGVPVSETELKKLAAELKNKCGCGGTVKNGVIEIQGDNRDKITEILKKYPWQVKRSGG